VRSSEGALAAVSSSAVAEEEAVSPAVVAVVAVVEAATTAFPVGAEIPAAAALATRCEQLPQNYLIRHNRRLQQTFRFLRCLQKKGSSSLSEPLRPLCEIFILSLNRAVAFAT
jgi:hypothetical protein